MPHIRCRRAWTRKAHEHKSVGSPSSSAEGASKANGTTWMGPLCDWSTYVHVSTSGLSKAVSFPPWLPKAKDSVLLSYYPTLSLSPSYSLLLSLSLLSLSLSYSLLLSLTLSLSLLLTYSLSLANG